jgi:hypothetical protein
VPVVAEFILYACPIGPLADAIQAYWRKVASTVGPNAAHDYMPHVTLTGFFHDERHAAGVYVDVLDRLLMDQPLPAVVTVTGALFDAGFHLLTVESTWCRAIARAFQDACPPSPPRAVVIRLKEQLHVSLAYGFPAHQAAALERLGRDMVDPASRATWELRFYERVAAGEWLLHGCWPLQPLDGSG